MNYSSCHSGALPIVMQIQAVIICGLGTDTVGGLQNAGKGHPGGLQIEMQVDLCSMQLTSASGGNIIGCE